jgi:uncharacterized protein (DUF924 family)
MPAAEDAAATLADYAMMQPVPNFAAADVELVANLDAGVEQFVAEKAVEAGTGAAVAAGSKECMLRIFVVADAMDSPQATTQASTIRLCCHLSQKNSVWQAVTHRALILVFG